MYCIIRDFVRMGRQKKVRVTALELLDYLIAEEYVIVKYNNGGLIKKINRMHTELFVHACTNNDFEGAAELIKFE